MLYYAYQVLRKREAVGTTNILNVGYHSTNYYLIGGHAATLLVDAGWPGTMPAFLHTLTRKGVRVETITYMLITHYHPDHAGLVQELKGKGVRLVVMEHQIASIPALKALVKPTDNYIDINLDDAITLSFDASRAFLHRLGIEGEMIPTPGHSDDSITLVLDEGVAFTGDLPRFSQEIGTEDRTLEQSWQRIRSLGVHTIYPGHGPAVGIQ